jgi:hypothetical protein
MARVVFDYGETVRARNTYRDPDTGVLTDPSSVTVVVRTPAGVETTYTFGVSSQLTKVSSGIYQLLIPLTLTGTYKWKWTGTAVDKVAVDYDECDSERKF